MRRPAIASLLLGIVLALSLIVVACSAQTAPAPSAPANAPGASAPTSAPAQSGQAAAKAEKVLTIGVAGDIETIDPPFGAATRANETIKNIYDQPLRYARKSTGEGYEIADVTKVEGSAWESFTIDPDGVTVRVKVRPGTKFTKSGNEVTADDVAYKILADHRNQLEALVEALLIKEELIKEEIEKILGRPWPGQAGALENS